MRKKENKTPKEILRDEDVEKAIKNYTVFTDELYRILTRRRMPPETVTLYNPDIALRDISILLNYIKKLEESHAYVYDAYQDLGKEKFKLEEKIDDKIKELEEEIERLEKNQNKIIALGGDDLHIREEIWQIEEQIKLLKSIIGE